MVLIFASVCVFSSFVAVHGATTSVEILNTTTDSNASNNHGRIVGGFAATEGQWPWQVAVRKSRSNGAYFFVCGGVLIGSNWALSAAHCFPESDITGLLLQFGVHDLTNPSQEMQLRFAASYRNHPSYDSSTFHADISLLYFTENLSFNYYIQPVGLPAASTAVSSGQKCIVSGFGETRGTGESLSVLRYAAVPIVLLPTCNAWYSDIGLTVTSDHICAGYEQGGVDSCQGDSGGPLVCHASSDSSLYVVQGITSFGYDCALARRPGAYTSVLSYTNWIVSYTNLEIGEGIPLIPSAAIANYRSRNYLWSFPFGLLILSGAIS